MFVTLDLAEALMEGRQFDEAARHGGSAALGPCCSHRGGSRMSAATDFLQSYITLKWQMDNDERFRPEKTRLSGRVDLGVEITIAEANPCRVIFHPTASDPPHTAAWTEIPSLAPGQKSYARSLPGSAAAGECRLLDAPVGVRLGPGASRR